jgi:radical SAM superfamily enzyme YgiQ (UPF0313 family)
MLSDGQGRPSSRQDQTDFPGTRSSIVADLILVQRRVRQTVAQLVRDLRPEVRIVVGGYDPSLAPEAYISGSSVDFIVRGEGEITFRELLRAIEHVTSEFGVCPQNS